MIIRTIVCDRCGGRETEREPNAGWPGWGQVNGISANGTDNPHLCPTCLKIIATVAYGNKEEVTE